MALINPVQIDVNEYGGNIPVNLYSYCGMELTVGQLVNAICSHVGDALETQSVSKMNLITQNARRLKGAAWVIENLVSGKVTSYDAQMDSEGYSSMTVRAFITDVMGYTIGGEGNIPDALDTYAKRLQLYKSMKEKLDAATTASQQDMIDLQTYLSRRDVAFASATNIVKTLGLTLQVTSGNFR